MPRSAVTLATSAISAARLESGRDCFDAQAPSRLGRLRER